jgi:multidrug resistance protein, MATE family
MQLESSNASANTSQSWWSRPCGGREVLAIALPLIVQSCFWSIMWFIDRLFLTWYSKEATAAALPGGMYHWTMICLPVGIASYVNTFVAQYYGAGRYRRIGNAVKQGIWFGWVTVPLFLLAIPLAPWLFAGVGSPETRQEMIIYFQVLALGAGASVITCAQSTFYTGRGLTAIVMLVNCIGTLLDISLEYMFIFGALGFPRLGIAGAAATTALSNWTTVLMFWALMRRRDDREKFGLDDNHFDWDLFRRLVRFGLPSGLPQLVEGVAFTMLTNAVASVGVIAGAATSIAFTVNAVAFVPMIGLNITVSTLVGQKLGENRPDLAERATWTALQFGMAYTGLFALLYVTVPDGFLTLHTAFAAGDDFAAVRATTVILLRFVALYCFFDAVQIMLVGALRGAGDTRFILGATGLTAIVFVTLGHFSERAFDWHARGIALWGWWWILTLWIFVLGVIYFLRFLGGRWKSMRVIEPELPDAIPPTPDQIPELTSASA